jgi:hypothetical protein
VPYSNCFVPCIALLLCLSHSSPAATIKGRITNPERQGSGVVGAQVEALRSGQKTTAVDIEGFFKLDSLRPGPDTLVVSAPGYETRYLPVIVPDSVLTLNIAMIPQTLWAGDDCYVRYNHTRTTSGHSTMTGRIRDVQSGSPLPSVYISLTSDYLDSTGTGHTCCCYTGTSDSTGSYVVHDIAAGYGTLTISAHGYRSESGKITVNAGKDLNADFELAPVADTVTTRLTGTVIGRVWDTRRMGPFPGATVSLFDGSRTVTTDQDGVFKLDSLAPGRHVLTISAPGYRSHQSTIFIIAGSTNRGGDAVLREEPR